MSLDPVIVLVARGSIVLLFGFHAWDKLRAPREFALAVGAYRLVPPRLVPLVAGLLVALEVGLALGGALGLRLAYATAGGLLLCYALGMLVNLARHRRYVDCGCGGPSQPISYALVARNVLLTGVAVMAMADLGGRAFTWLDGFTVSIAVLCVAIVYAAINDLLAARALFDEAEA